MLETDGKNNGNSTKGQLVVWGPVVWIPRTPLRKEVLLRGTLGIPNRNTYPWKSKSTVEIIGLPQVDDLLSREFESSQNWGSLLGTDIIP